DRDIVMEGRCRASGVMEASDILLGSRAPRSDAARRAGPCVKLGRVVAKLLGHDMHLREGVDIPSSTRSQATLKNQCPRRLAAATADGSARCDTRSVPDR